VIRRVTHAPNRRVEKLAFGAEDLRPLRIIVDGETVPDGPELEVLLGFGHHPHVEVIGTDDRFPIRVEVGDFDAKMGGCPWNLKFEDGRRSMSAVFGDRAAQLGRRSADPGQEDRAAFAAVLAAGARAHDCDALATTDPMLLAFPYPNFIEGVNPMTPRDTLALLGLFLRVREDFPIYFDDGFQLNFGRSLFYDMLVREYVPASWRWFAGAAVHARHVSDDSFRLTAQSALERLERALRARDRMHVDLQRRASRETATDALFYFDVGLLMLGGAFDSLARVADRALGLCTPPAQISWGNSWPRKLKGTTLGSTMRKSTPHGDAWRLVALLRNTIHYAIFETVTWQTGGLRDERAAVPDDVAAEVEEVVIRLGGLDQFGMRRELDTLFVEPGVCFEALLPRAFAAIDAIMAATPIEDLAGVGTNGVLPVGPPSNNGTAFDTFSQANRDRVRLLGGVG